MNRFTTSAAIAALALGASVAHADEFDFRLAGAGIAQITDPTPCTRDDCDPNVAAVWDGSVLLTLASSGDGIYSTADIESVAVESNWQSYTWHNGDPGLFGNDSVTVQDGVVTDFEFNWVVDAAHFENFQVFTYPGSSFISASATGDCVGCGRPDATGYQFPSGSLTPIPEPASAGLWLVGLGLLATGWRRRA